MRSRPASTPLALALVTTLLALAGCGGDPGGSVDTDAGGDDVHHLAGPGCTDGPVRYASPAPTGAGAAERALPGLRHVATADAFAASLCSDFCHAAERCGDDFGGRAACLAHCAGLVDAGDASRATCYASDCRQRARCLEGPAVEAVTGCPQLCAAVASCPGLGVLGLTPDAAACTAQCAGRAAALTTFSAAVPCLASAATACNLDDALACLPHGRAFSPAVCLEVDACPAGSALAGVWPSRQACFDEVDARTPVMAFKAQECFERFGCDADRSCIDAVPPICEAYFGEARRSCDAATSWPPSFELLAATCDDTRFSGLTDTSEVAACLAARGDCDALETRLCPAVATVDRVARCEDICSAMCDCALMTQDDCVGLCASTSNTDAELETLEGCVAEGSCERLTACTDEVLAGSALATARPGADPCDRYCSAVSDCDGAAAAVGCRAACAARLDAGDAAPLAAVGCYEAGGCAAFATCDASAPASLACQSACDGATVACGGVLAGFDAGLGSCAAYCAGLVTTWGHDDATTAACVVGGSDARCVLPAEAGCAP